MSEPFDDFYRNKRVLITGHTGFKGSWLAMWLTALGAKVIGYSDAIPTQPSMFEICKIKNQIIHLLGDVRDFNKLDAVCQEHRPEIVFHMAAQALVRPAQTNTILMSFEGTCDLSRLKR